MRNRFSEKLTMSKRLVFFSIVLLFITSIPLYFSYLQYQQVIKLTQDKLVLQNQQLTFYVEKSFDNTRALLSRTLRLMAQGSKIHNYLLEPSPENRAVLEAFLVFIAQDQQMYNQICFLDNQGQEVVRVNYNSKTNSAQPVTHLQNKSQRPYFMMAQSLRANEQGLSTLDLEKEEGKYIQPYQAAYRIIMPVEFENVRYGYMIINVETQYYMQNLAQMRLDIQGLTILTSQGFYVLHKDRNKLYGDILSERKAFNLAHENPPLWRYMQNRDKGEYRGEQAISIFKRITLSEGASPVSLIILAQLDRASVVQSQTDTLNAIKVEAVMIVLFFLCIGIPCMLYLAKIEHRRLQERLVSVAMRGISAIVVTDRANQIIKVNKQFTQITGYSEEEALGKNPGFFKSGKHTPEFYQTLWGTLASKEEWEGEITNIHKDGHEITELSRILVIKNQGEIINYVASFVDISDRKILEDKLRHLCERDALTQLWNRRIFEKRLAFQSKEIERYPEHHFCCLAVLDIDFFKRVNDTYGHQKGDEVIQQVALTLVSDSRDVDTVARIGGEEFAILLPHTHLQDAIMLLNRQREKIEAISDIGVTISAGVVELTTECLDEEAYKAADMALYKAKQTGRNQVCT